MFSGGKLDIPSRFRKMFQEHEAGKEITHVLSIAWYLSAQYCIQCKSVESTDIKNLCSQSDPESSASGQFQKVMFFCFKKHVLKLRLFFLFCMFFTVGPKFWSSVASLGPQQQTWQSLHLYRCVEILHIGLWRSLRD